MRSGPDFGTNSQNIKKCRFFSILVPDAKEEYRVLLENVLLNFISAV